VIPGWKNVSNVYDVLIYAEKGKRRGYLDGSFTRDLGTWSFNIEQNTTDSPDKQPGYLITDRGVYKQGDPVFVKGIVRAITNEIFAAPGNMPVSVTVDDRSGTAVYSNRLSLSEFGGFDFRFEIPKEGELGDYSIRAEVGDESYNVSVYVAQYRAPVFRNTVGSDGGVKILGDKARFSVKGEYLFGAPLKKGEVKWFFTSSASAFTPTLPLKDDTSDKWSFRHNVKYLDEKEKDIPHPSPSSGTGELADDGGFQITLPLDHKTWLEPRTYQFEAEVVSLDKQAVASRTAVLVHPSQWYLGLRRDNYFVDTGKVFSTKVFCLTPSGEPVDGQQISLKLTKRSWKSTKKKAFDQSYYAETEAYDELVNTQNVTSKKDPLAVSFTVTNGGYYILRAEGKDSRGNPVLSSYDFYAIGKGYSTWALGDSDTIELIPEQSSVRPGDTLRVLIKSPFEKCKALLTLERGKVLESRWLDLVGSMPVVEIPVRREHIPNFFVSVVLMKGRETFEVTPDFIDKGVPVVKLGYTSISVIPDEARLTVDLRSDKKIYEPGEWVNLKVRASASDKKGERSEIALFAVDEAVLSLTGYEPPDPLQYFYGNRPMGVTTLDSRPFVIHQRYFGSKGTSPGGGGGGGPDIKLRSDFQTTPFWQGALVTGADGNGEAKFKLPDNLTTFKIFAVAAGTARFGKAVNAITVKKDFMLLPSFPRFAMRGDTFYAAVTAHNLTKKSGAVELSLAADEKSKALGDVSSIKFTLPPESSTNLRIGFRAELDGSSTFKVQGKITFGSESKT
ncbi:MAG: hypothetical protein JNM63_12575, partial [Spirochaetia bacterium]|nr:hypothetical protein [Spirochaetia bacterium]